MVTKEALTQELPELLQRGPRRVTAAEFVAQLDETNQAVLRRLEPEATLKPEVSGALNVTNLLKVALKNEIEATEIAARWLVATTDVEVKMAFARQAGDEAKHYRMIADRLGELGFDARSLRSARPGVRAALQVPRLAPRPPWSGSRPASSPARPSRW